METFTNFLTLFMPWVLSGLFVAFLMKHTDNSCVSNYKWTQDDDSKEKNGLPTIILLVIAGPLSLLLGIFVMRYFWKEG